MTGGLPFAQSKQVIKYFADGTYEVLPNLLIPRKAHSCGSYFYGGKEVNRSSHCYWLNLNFVLQMLIVVAGDTITSSNSVMSTNTVEIYDLSTPGTAWVSTTNFPFFISGSRAVTLDNVFYVTGR